MWATTAAAMVIAQESSEAVRELAQQLRMHADAVEEARGRLGAAQISGWDSPAGRNFRSCLDERSNDLIGTAAELREAAVLMEGYAATLEGAADLPTGVRG